MVNIITSASNPVIKQIVKIRKDKKYRKDKNKALVVGKKAIEDIKKTKEFEILITTKKIHAKKARAKKVLIVSKKIMKKITNIEAPEEVAAIIDTKDSKKITKKQYILILDGVSDPGNLGTLIRSANAFNFDLIIITKRSVDPYNEKALRSAKGSTFFIPIKVMEKEKVLDFLKINNINVYLADIEGENIKKVKFKKPAAIVLSNESKGPSQWIEEIATKVTISMKKDIDSLNVAAAGSIFMFFMRN